MASQRLTRFAQLSAAVIGALVLTAGALLPVIAHGPSQSLVCSGLGPRTCLGETLLTADFSDAAFEISAYIYLVLVVYVSVVAGGWLTTHRAEAWVRTHIFWHCTGVLVYCCILMFYVSSQI